jgi:serine protease
MVALSRCLSSLALLIGQVESGRVVKHASETPSNSKFIAGVPVVNYHAAYGGESSLSAVEASREEEWLVMLQPGATDAQIKGLCQKSRLGCQMTGHADSGGVPFIDMKGTENDVKDVIKSNRAVIKFIEPSQTLHMIPELDADPNSSPSWGLNRVGVDRQAGNKGAGTHIFILDTGVRTTHQDFGGRASPGVDYSSGQPVECNGDLQCAADNQGHGTHCAGTAGGNSFGVASQAAVYGVKVLGDSGAGGLAGIIGGIDWAASSSARPAVASMSLGGQCPLGWCGVFGAIKDAVNAAVQSGVTVVVAGGNSNSDACGFMPAFVPVAITVGSTDSEDARSSFSNYGSCTDIWAPGSSITSASHEDDVGSKTFSGTSMACPHVAGGAALVLEKNPSFTAEQVVDKLLANSAVNYITDLKDGDTNSMLYVAADAPPPQGEVPPSPAPECPGWCFVCWVSACEGCC